MMYLAVREDDIARAESLADKIGKDFGDSLMFSVAKGDTALVTKLLAEAKDPSSHVGRVVGGSWQVGQWLQRPDAAEPFLRVAIARPEHPLRGVLLLGEMLVSQGRWAASDSMLREAAVVSNDFAPQLARGVWAALPFLALPRSELEAIRADVAAVDPARQSTRTPGPAVQLLPQVRTYALALLDSRLGNASAALRGASELETSPAATEYLPVMHAMAAAIRADVALAARRPAEAVTLLAAAKGMVPLELVELHPFAEDYARFLRAEALLELGKDADALRWLENGLSGTAGEMAYWGPVSLRLGEIYERKGDRQKAIDQYSRFVRLWGACDPRLRPAVEDARTRLARLTAEPRS